MKEKTDKEPQDQWLENDQLANFEILQMRKVRADATEYRNGQTKFERPKTSPRRQILIPINGLIRR
jgi:hypothetical protein